MTDAQDQLGVALARDVDRAFPDLVRSHQDAVYATLRRLTPDVAEDLTQETFVRAYRALREWPPARRRDLRARPWLLTIATNLARNDARRRTRRPATRPLDEHDAAVPAAPGRTDWDALLGTLELHVRTAIVLRHVVGLPIAEIAEVLHRPAGTVKSDIHRGLARLRTALDPEEVVA